MLTRYLQSAMKLAKYELLEDGTCFASIPGFEGVWANGASPEACREELSEVLEDWLLIGLAKSHPLPVVDGIDLRVSEVV